MLRRYWDARTRTRLQFRLDKGGLVLVALRGSSAPSTVGSATLTRWRGDYELRLRITLRLSLVLVVVFALVAVAGLPPGGTFSDDDGNTHERNIEAIAAAGVTKGV